MKGKFKCLIVLFLVLVIILPIQKLEISAGIISNNEVTEADSNDKQAINLIVPETISEEEGMPSAPIHHCSPDYTDFSYIYFGSYPQSEVTDSVTIAAIESAISISGAEINEDLGIDVWVGDTRYRRISRSDNDGGYSWNSDYRYFKWEPIKWEVLQNDGNTLFVMADTALDGKSYHDVKEKITWEDSSIRNWLNNNFYNTAFNSSEQEAIVEQTVVTANQYIGTNGEIITKDKVYLLSQEEACAESYGFNDYGTHPISRRIQPSDFAYAKGVGRITSNGDKGKCWWKLRSSSSGSDGVTDVVDDNGSVAWSSSVTNLEGVCPVLHVNLLSNLWSVADKENGEEAIPVNPVYHHSNDVTTWCYVYFGSYPQSEVTDVDIIAGIEAEISQQLFGSQADICVDVLIDDTKYRRVSKSNCNNIYFWGDKEYHYFKWEPIRWKVLFNDEESLFVIADKILDCKNYNEEDVNITWEECTLRSWLNENFYDAAFSDDEQDAIITQTIVNDNNFYYGTQGGNKVEDNVYLLSMGEVTNSDYGFCSNHSIDSESRRVQGTPYANVNGTSIFKTNNCVWWLRSPGIYKNRVSYVDYYGHANKDGYGVDTGTCGVCPALYIDLQSNLWSIADDVIAEEDKLLTNIQVSKQKITYEQGEPLNVEDLKVIAYYQSYPEQVLAADSYTTNAAAIDMNIPGSKMLTISYTEGTITKTGSIIITVNPKADTNPKVNKGTQITDQTSEGKYTVTGTDLQNPTVSYDGSTDPDAKSVTIPEYITYNGVRYKVTTVSTKSFNETKSNGKYTVTNNQVGNLTVEYTGATNTKKKTITIPEYVTYQGVKYKVTSVKAKSFKGNKKLTAVNIATGITKIGDSCFEGCTNLKSVTIGKGLQTIGKNAFKNCRKLTKITIKSSKLKTVGKNALKGINAKCKIKVPSKKLKKYQKLFKKKGQKSSVKVVK